MANHGQIEAICLLLDCGKSMSRLYDNSDETLLSLSKSYITNIIRQKKFAESKNVYVLMQFSANSGSRSIINFCNFKFFNMWYEYSLECASFKLLRYVSQIKNNTDANETNVIDALTEAFNTFLKLIKGQKFSAVKLALFTDFGNVKRDDIEELTHLINYKFAENNIQLIVICDKTLRANNNVIRDQILTMIDKNSNCLCLDIKDAIRQSEKFECKKSSSMPWYTYLEIGKGMNSVRLPITGYIKVSEFKRKSGIEILLPSATNDDNNNNEFVINNDTEIESDADITKFDVRKTANYRQKNDKSGVNKEDVIQAYRFGSELNKINDEFRLISEYKSSEKGLKVIGFTSNRNILPEYRIGDKTMIIMSDPRYNTDIKSIKEFQALSKALFDTKEVAIVRYAYRNESSPQIGYLFPHIENKDSMLAYNQLPFSEDYSHYRFPSLHRKPGYRPSSEQLNAIDELIDSMDLMSAGIDEECGEVCEALQSENINSPFLKHWYQCLYNSYLNKDKPIPSKQLKDTIDIPRKIRQNAETSLRKVSQIFTLRNLKVKILPESDDPKNTGLSIYYSVETEIRDGLKSNNKKCIDKALELLEIYRRQSISRNEPNCFNRFMLDVIKAQIRGTDIWPLLLWRGIKVISKLECEASVLTQENADAFYLY